MAQHNDIGKLGEDLAVEYLEKDGFQIFDRNYNYEKNEIDIVAFWQEPAEIHFVEVKTRTGDAAGTPAEALTEEQQKNIASVAQFYIWERQMITVPTVFDVIGVDLSDPDNPQFEHHEDVFRPS